MVSATDEPYFLEQLANNEEFFTRFGAEPEWTGRKVLDVGCGHGALSIRAAEHGAARVVGVDISSVLIKFARDRLGTLPDLAERVAFVCEDVATVHDRFDLIVSKDAFEHIADVPEMLRLLRERLAPDGEIWIGFSPLYHSPFGSHGLTRIPWAHSLPWPIVRRILSRNRGRPIAALTDLGLNGLTARKFRTAVAGSGLRIKSIGYNRGGAGVKRRLLVAFDALRKVPGFEKYVTVSIYAVLTH